MKGLAAITRSLRDRFPPPRTDPDEETRQTFPFFIIVTIVLLVLYGSAVYSSPGLRTTGKLIPLTGLFALHIILYWLVAILPGDLRWEAGYLILQGLVALALTLLARNQLVIVGLFPALIGISVGVLRTRRLAVIAIVVYLSLAAYSTIYILGWDALAGWAWVAFPVTIFTVVYVELFMRQADARAQAQALLAELEAAHMQLAEYAARVEDLTLTAERQRMARELHDTLAQGLAGLILQLEAGNSHLENGHPARAQEIVQQAMGRARDTLADARRAIGDLRMAADGLEDLEETVLREVKRFTIATGIPCELELNLFEPLPDALTDHASRIVSEAFANVAQHAHASRVWLHVTADAEQLTLTIRDDGQGFEPALEARAGHYGLVGMRERARLAGGAMALETARGAGTSLSFILPLQTPK
jgi:NarL family two-component system sensor histidine kinase YdfH